MVLGVKRPELALSMIDGTKLIENRDYVLTPGWYLVFTQFAVRRGPTAKKRL